MPLDSKPFLVLLLACIFPGAGRAGMAVTGSLGADSRDHFRGARFAYNAACFAKFDDQTLLGIQSGQGTVAGGQAIPVFASAVIRLPLGRIILPEATGDVGYAIDGHRSGFIWRAGGGFDIRNGRQSSLLLLGAYERQGSAAGWSGRLGILLEF